MRHISAIHRFLNQFCSNISSKTVIRAEWVINELTLNARLVCLVQFLTIAFINSRVRVFFFQLWVDLDGNQSNIGTTQNTKQPCRQMETISIDLSRTYGNSQIIKKICLHGILYSFYHFSVMLDVWDLRMGGRLRCNHKTSILSVLRFGKKGILNCIIKRSRHLDTIMNERSCDVYNIIPVVGICSLYIKNL